MNESAARSKFIAFLVATASSCATPPARPSALPPSATAITTPPPPIRLNPPDIPWTAAPPTLPAGAKIAVIEGDPRKPGIFTMRLRLPAGARLNPHTHPVDERITVISGSISVGYGDKFDSSNGKTFTAGAFYVTPTPMPHYVWAEEECVIQVTGPGPWGLKFLEPSDEKRSE